MAQFFQQVLNDMECHSGLQEALYNNQEDFYHEEIPSYNQKAMPTLQSNKIRKSLHEILTKAIFTYQPCCDLLHFCKKKKDTDATRISWAKANKEWTVFGTEPYQHVSIYIQNLFLLVLTKSYAIFLDSCN